MRLGRGWRGRACLVAERPKAARRRRKAPSGATLPRYGDDATRQQSEAMGGAGGFDSLKLEGARHDAHAPTSDVAADDHTVVRRLTATPLPTVNTP